MKLHWYLYSKFRRHLMCRLGLHDVATARSGQPANFCGWGCGHTFNHNAYQTWVVTLRTGEVVEVQAVNEFHAGSQVVYGRGPGRIDGKTGLAIAEVKCHRGNIISAVPKHTDGATA